MQTNNSFRDETIAFLSKWWSYFFYVFIGIVGKFSFNIVNKKKMSLWYAIGTTGISCFTGFLVSMYCKTHNPAYAPYMVPMCTLFADKILMSFAAYVDRLNWKALMASIYEFITKQK